MSKQTSTSAPTATSPMVQVDLSQFGTSPSVLSVEEHAFLGHVNLRGDADNSNFMRAAKTVLGVDLPIVANTYIENGGNTILWLGPNEWLIITPQDKAAELVVSLEAALAEVFSAVNEVSGGNTVLELSGTKAQALLLKGCPLDLHHSVFGPGQCAQTVIAKTSMTLWCIDDAPVYRLIVRRSFADYLGLWLLDAAQEFQN